MNKIDRLKLKLGCLVDKISGKGCENCRYNNNDVVCNSPNYEKCMNSIFPKGYKKRK